MKPISKRQKIRQFLLEREEIVARYKAKLGAEYIEGRWYVYINGEEVNAVDALGANKDLLSLLVNHAYLQGARDLAYGFGVLFD